jgi:hypothetical protein
MSILLAGLQDVFWMSKFPPRTSLTAGRLNCHMQAVTEVKGFGTANGILVWQIHDIILIQFVT